MTSVSAAFIVGVTTVVICFLKLRIECDRTVQIGDCPVVLPEVGIVAGAGRPPAVGAVHLEGLCHEDGPTREVEAGERHNVSLPNACGDATECLKGQRVG